jgi:hypothetical protein
MIQLFASAARMLTDEPPAGVFTEKPVNTLPAAAGRDTEESCTAALPEVLAERLRVVPVIPREGAL